MSTNQNQTCFLCGRPCTMRTHNEVWDVGFYDCSSCGTYGLDRKTQLNYCHSEEEREKASHLAAEWFIHEKPSFILSETNDTLLDIQGESFPCFTLESFLQKYPRDSVEILDRTLLNLAQLNDFPGKPVNFKRFQNVDQPQQPAQMVTFCTEWRDFINLILILEHEGFLQVAVELKNPNQQVASDFDRANAMPQLSQLPIQILPKGLERVRTLRKQTSGNLPQAFVAMWFDSSRDKFFPHIEKATKEAGFEKCLRIDRKETNDKICDEIIAEIRKSQCLIADFTGNRGGVYFEAGFALGLGIPVIWLVDANWWNETDKNGKRINDLHFDTRQYAHIDYRDENDLYKRLKARIEATVPIRKS